MSEERIKMMKFRNATWLLVVSVMLTASKVNGVMLKDHKLNIPKFFILRGYWETFFIYNVVNKAC